MSRAACVSSQQARSHQSRNIIKQQPLTNNLSQLKSTLVRVLQRTLVLVNWFARAQQLLTLSVYLLYQKGCVAPSRRLSIAFIAAKPATCDCDGGLSAPQMKVKVQFCRPLIFVEDPGLLEDPKLASRLKF
jgi:hypothetical protein